MPIYDDHMVSNIYVLIMELSRIAIIGIGIELPWVFGTGIEIEMYIFE